jgi:hypothetical protein
MGMEGMEVMGRLRLRQRLVMEWGMQGGVERLLLQQERVTRLVGVVGMEGLLQGLMLILQEGRQL